MEGSGEEKKSDPASPPHTPPSKEPEEVKLKEEPRLGKEEVAKEEIGNEGEKTMTEEEEVEFEVR